MSDFPRSVVLTFDDACRSHLYNAVPVLERYGFGATFFICHFVEEKYQKIREYMLNGEEIREIYDRGFEIGNHTWDHHSMRILSDDERRWEIEEVEKFLSSCGIDKPVNFAYPGGPFAPEAVPVLKEKGFYGARTTEKRTWIYGVDDPMRIPAIPVQGDDEKLFFDALDFAVPEKNKAAVLVFHGVPDLAHPHCSLRPELFEKYMNYLYEHDYRVLSMRDFMYQAKMI